MYDNMYAVYMDVNLFHNSMRFAHTDGPTA